MTLTLDFEGQILKKLYHRNKRVDWHGTKRMWVNRMLDQSCDFKLWPHPWPWPSLFNDKFWNSCIAGMGGPIDMQRKGCESIGCYIYFVTLSYDLDLGFSRSNFENAVSQEWEDQFTWNQRGWVDRMLDSLWPWILTSPMTLTLDLQGQFLK